METVKVKTKLKNYNIHISNGILKEAGDLILKEVKIKKAMVITDINVYELYGSKFSESLKKAKIDHNFIVVEPGEKSKSFDTLNHIYSELIKYNITRADAVIALGGGVIGDLAGFAAATYLRGTKFIQVPTTLLSQVDSSVGGKVGVNLKEGKNLVGAFYQPEVVLIDTDTLNTLSEREFKSGMAEVIKYGCIYDDKLFLKLKGLDASSIKVEIKSVIKTCVEIKRDVVEIDERDRGLRKILNFGHTLGHAIEKVEGYGKYTHGEAIAIGMYKMSLEGEKRNITKLGTSKALKEIFKKYNIKTEYKMINPEEIIEAIRSDKKSEAECIDLVFISQIGKSELIRVELNKIEEYFEGDIV